MLPPVQNQDMVNRSDAMSQMRSFEQGKAFGDIAKAMAEMQRLEELKNNSVQKNDETDALNPDGGSEKDKDQQQGKKKQGEEDAQPETNTPAGHPIKLDGGDVLDLMA
ncbi:MAG: hypothetical protein FWB90_04775 [Fibromonadales bacterium]|nr:hypothetical protein [Fibromonadales bacterium]